VVRTAAVKSLDLDPAPAPAATTSSRKVTAEVSYATPTIDGKGNATGKDAGDKGKGC
jgi:hypothetical protein